MISIQLNNVSKHYGAQKALDNVSFQIESNRIIGFLGPNGAGKSTTMKTIAGVIAVEMGTVFVRTINIQERPIEAKRKIGYLAEDNPLYPDMYIREILSFEADIHQLKDKQKRIDEVLFLTGLEEEQNKKIKQLSKGYKQRVGLALAIIHDPEILILDEPTAGLDPNQIIEIRALIQRLSTHKTVLLSTHILQEVDAICDEIIIINKGQIKDHFTKTQQTEKYKNMTTEEVFVQLTTCGI